MLVVLARTRAPLTGREIARLTPRGSQRGVAMALERLVEQGVVASAEAGRSNQFILNRDHLAAPAVEAMESMRSRLWELIRTSVAASGDVVVHASAFGSAARGDGDSASDIDLLLVHRDDVDPEGSDWRGTVAGLGESVRRWTGNHASIVELSESDLPDLARARPELATALTQDAVTLVGLPVAAILDRS